MDNFIASNPQSKLLPVARYLFPLPQGAEFLVDFGKKRPDTQANRLKTGVVDAP